MVLESNELKSVPDKRTRPPCRYQSLRIRVDTLLFLLIPIAALGALAWLLLGSEIPLGIPGEWVWQRYQNCDLPLFELVGGLLAFALALAIAWCLDLKKGTGAIARRLGLIAILLLGSWMDFQVLLAGKIGLTENVYAVLDRHTTGYLAEAAAITDFRQYFSRFNERQEKQRANVHHLDVHPPGNIAIAYAVLSCCRRHLDLAVWLQNRLPYDVSLGLKQARTYRFFGTLLDAPEVYPAACVMVLLMLAALCLARFSLVLTVRMLAGSRCNLALAACLLATLPGPILFLGHFDVLLFAWSSVCVCFFVRWLTISGRSRMLWSLATGFSCGIGVVLTLGYGIIIALFVVVMLVRAARDGRKVADLALFGAGGLLVIGICHLCGVRIVEICFLCMRNNTQFYLDTARSWRWLLVNPLEFVLFFGVLWVGVTALYLRQCPFRRLFTLAPEDLLRLFAWVFLIYLMIHPYCRGEMGRLALLYMPIPLVICARDLMHAVKNRRGWLFAAFAGFAGLLQIFLLRAILKLAFFYGRV